MDNLCICHVSNVQRPERAEQLARAAAGFAADPVRTPALRLRAAISRRRGPYDEVVEQPLVTIVTPSLNQGRFIRETIESVLGQDYPRLEYLIIDGGSADETAAVAAEYGSRLTFLSEPDRGQSDAINKGFRRARGQILAWLNSDDVLLPGAVSAAVRALGERPDCAAVYGEGYRMDESGRILGRFPFTEPFNLWKLVSVTDYVLQQTLFMRRAALEEAGYLDVSLRYTMDWDLLIRLGKRYRIHYIPEFLGAIREYGAAKSFAGGRARLREIRQMLRRHTGRRWAPGAVMYMLEHCRRWLLPPVTGRWADHIRNHAQGLYRDGWAGQRLRYLLPAGAGEIGIRGLTPVRQTLRVLRNGRLACENVVNPGAFMVRFPAEGLAQLEIVASGRFRPASLGAEEPRRLAYVLRSIDWI